jgi:hypothetical protein
MPIDADRFKKLAAGWQSIVFAVGLPLGGIWTFYAFNSQLQVQNAHAQLQVLERQLASRPRVGVHVSATQLEPTKEYRYPILGTVEIRNTGSKDYQIELSKVPPISVYAVSFDGEGKESWTLVRQARIRLSAESIMGAIAIAQQTTGEHEFLTFVDRPGLYVVAFSVDIGSEDHPPEEFPVNVREPAEGQARRVKLANRAYLSVVERK